MATGASTGADTQPAGPFSDSFTKTDSSWQPLVGDWKVTGGVYQQSQTNGYDLISAYTGAMPKSYTVSVRFRGVGATSNAGLVLGLPQLGSRMGGTLVDLANQNYLRWGKYDATTGNYTFIGGVTLGATVVAKAWQTLTVQETPTGSVVLWNGKRVGTFDAIAAGYAGLASSAVRRPVRRFRGDHQMTAALLDRPAGAPGSADDVAVPVIEASAPAAPKRRDSFLDTVRAVALIRVIIWHTLALTVVSWIVASMPAMFFVAGSLLARGLDRQPLKQLYTTRLKRLLIPFWSFAAVVLTVLVVVHHLDPTAANGFSPKSLLPWIFPIVDPHGNAWEAGWASTPLWYLRCYLWLLLLSPLLRKAHRRWGLKILVVPIVLVFVLDYYIRHPESDSAVFHAVRYYLADVTTFSIFWILGFSHSDGAIAGLDRRHAWNGPPSERPAHSCG